MKRKVVFVAEPEELRVEMSLEGQRPQGHSKAQMLCQVHGESPRGKAEAAREHLWPQACWPHESLGQGRERKAK